MPVLLHHASDRLIQADRGTVVDLPEWFTVQPRPRHEKRILAELLAKGVVAFLPVVSTIKRWSDRRRVVELPLFFAVRLCANRTEFCRAGFGVMGQRSHQVCASSGHRSSAPGPENRTNTTGRRAGHIGFSSHILECGQSRTHPGGALDGLSGIRTAVNGDQTLVLSVNLIQRSLGIRIAGW